MLGKKLYKTSMLWVFKLCIFVIFLFFLNNFYLETFTYEKFRAEGHFVFLDVIKYYLKYPKEFILFFCLIFIPAFYYAIIRGVRFCEKGFFYNKGIPFMNRPVLYEDVKSYKLLHPKKAISISVNNGDIFLIADNDVERVIAILDQHNIKGDLASDEYVKLITNYKKFVLMILGFSAFVFVFLKLGLFQP